MGEGIPFITTGPTSSKKTSGRPSPLRWTAARERGTAARAAQPFLEGEEGEGGLIASCGRELREAGDVRKHDGAGDGLDGGGGARGAHGPVTSTEPEKVLALMSKSVPWGQSQRSLPESVRTLMCGRLPSATRTVTRPEMDLTSTSSSPAVPTSTLPLRVETRAAFSTLPMRMWPLLVFPGRRPPQVLTLRWPLTLRTSTSPLAESISMWPETADTLTEPNSPASSTPPEMTPMDTLVPFGQRTWRLPERDFTSAVRPPSFISTWRSGGSTSRSSRSSAGTTIWPELGRVGSEAAGG